MLLMAACVPIAPAETAAEPMEPALLVVTTGPLMANHIYNVAGNHVSISMTISPGTDPHHYEPTPSDVTKLVDADIVFIRGAARPQAIRARLKAIVGDDTEVVLLAQNIDSDQFIYDDHGAVDLHMGGDSFFVLKYAEVIRDTLVESDPANADAYQSNYDEYVARIEEMEAAIEAVVASIPEENRLLFSYHS